MLYQDKNCVPHVLLKNGKCSKVEFEQSQSTSSQAVSCFTSNNLVDQSLTGTTNSLPANFCQCTSNVNQLASGASLSFSNVERARSRACAFVIQTVWQNISDKCHKCSVIIILPQTYIALYKVHAMKCSITCFVLFDLACFWVRNVIHFLK